MNTEQGGLVENVFNLSFLKCIFQKEELLSHKKGFPLPESVSVSVKTEHEHQHLRYPSQYLESKYVPQIRNV